MVIIFLIHFALCRSGKSRIFSILSRSGPIVLCHLMSHVIRPANRVIVIVEVAILELTIAEIEIHVEREVAVGERVVETTIELRVSSSEILVVIVGILSEVCALYDEYKKVLSGIKDAKEMITAEDDVEMKEMAREELKELEDRQPKLEEEIKLKLVPPDPLDEKNIILEIRSAAGGDEASLFVRDLWEMYTHLAERKGWKTETMEAQETEVGGFNKIVTSISGKFVYGTLRWESGVHRVQRVPQTESQGRLQTSTATVAVLPEAEETEIEIKPGDVRVDVMRAGGPGGQCVNTTDSAVRLTHIPTGLVMVSTSSL